MKRKGLKILCGVLATLCVVGATSTIVGALSDGFKNWDTSTWFDKEQTISSVYGSVSEIESSPFMKMNAINTVEDSFVNMNNVVIEAKTTVDIEECKEFHFIFSYIDSNVFTYELTANTVTLHFLKKPTKTLSITAQTKKLYNGIAYRSSIKIDSLRALTDFVDFVSPSSSKLGYYHSSGVYFDYSKLALSTNNDSIGFDMSIYSSMFEDSGTIIEPFTISNINYVLEEGFEDLSVTDFFELRDNRFYVSPSKETIESIINHPIVHTKYQKFNIFTLSFDVTGNFTKKKISGNFTVGYDLPNYQEGNVDMGGNIVVR